MCEIVQVAIVVSHAALPSEEYWNSVLPNTPMPKAVKHLLNPTSGTVYIHIFLIFFFQFINYKLINVGSFKLKFPFCMI